MRYVVLLLLSLNLWAAETKFHLENTHIVTLVNNEDHGDYNRFRFYGDLFNLPWDCISAALIADNINQFNLSNGENENKTSLYRAHVRYGGERQFLTVGLQRIPFGVGRIWNPIDIFNPINITAIETQERKGTEALRYEYAPSALSSFDLTLSKYKHAIRVKNFWEVADFALIALHDSQNDQDILGYEAEGELAQTNITIRSEGGRFHDKKNNHIFYASIVGAEYGFENSLTMLVEFHHQSLDQTRHIATHISYQPSPLWTTHALILKNLGDKSMLFSPSLSYSLSDESTLEMGVYLANADVGSEFGEREDRIYLRYFQLLK